MRLLRMVAGRGEPAQPHLEVGRDAVIAGVDLEVV